MSGTTGKGWIPMNFLAMSATHHAGIASARQLVNIGVTCQLLANQIQEDLDNGR